MLGFVAARFESCLRQWRLSASAPPPPPTRGKVKWNACWWFVELADFAAVPLAVGFLKVSWEVWRSRWVWCLTADVTDLFHSFGQSTGYDQNARLCCSFPSIRHEVFCVTSSSQTDVWINICLQFELFLGLQKALNAGSGFWRLTRVYWARGG
jgi:hypothetical protein